MARLKLVTICEVWKFTTKGVHRLGIVVTYRELYLKNTHNKKYHIKTIAVPKLFLSLLNNKRKEEIKTRIKSLRVENLKKNDFFSTGISIPCKKYYKTLSISNNYTILKVLLVDIHGIPFNNKPKRFYDRKFVKNFIPIREKLKCY